MQLCSKKAANASAPMMQTFSQNLVMKMCKSFPLVNIAAASAKKSAQRTRRK
jgi:hypothetical protein